MKGQSAENTFMSKFWEDSEKVSKKLNNDNVHILKWVFRFLYQFQAWTQLYMTLCHLTPTLFADLEPETRYYVKVFFTYLFVQCQANWLAAICTASPVPRGDMEALEQPSVGSTEPWKDTYGATWAYCATCQRHRPPRAHHCPLCATCVLRRDHHCYMIGVCIGHYNQRYFIPWLLNTSLVAALGLTMTLLTMSLSTDAKHWYDYFLPCTGYKYLYGGVSGDFLLLSFHTFMMAVFGPMAMIYCSGQMIMVITGKTLHETAKKTPMLVTSLPSENLRLVFGACWPANFLFPAVAAILFKQRDAGTVFEGVRFGDEFVDPSLVGKLNVE